MNHFSISEGKLRESLGRIIRFRDVREASFGKEIFGDPGWDILLDLAVSKLEQKDIGVTSACIASRAPHATAHRYLQRLLDAGFLEIVDDRSYGRRTNVRLTERGFAKMCDLLTFEEK